MGDSGIRVNKFGTILTQSCELKVHNEERLIAPKPVKPPTSPTQQCLITNHPLWGEAEFEIQSILFQNFEKKMEPRLECLSRCSTRDKEEIRDTKDSTKEQYQDHMEMKEPRSVVFIKNFPPIFPTPGISPELIMNELASPSLAFDNEFVAPPTRTHNPICYDKTFECESLKDGVELGLLSVSPPLKGEDSLFSHKAEERVFSRCYHRRGSVIEELLFSQ